MQTCINIYKYMQWLQNGKLILICTEIFRFSNKIKYIFGYNINFFDLDSKISLNPKEKMGMGRNFYTSEKK